jgi:AGZA family xanthine/uracil permease-like MFS transporter
MILAAMTVCLIERKFRAAAAWAAVAAVVSASGLMHGYEIANGAIINAYGPSHTWPFVLGYCGIAAVFVVLGLREDKTARQAAPLV